MLMQVRRWDDNILLNDDCKEFSGFRWQYVKPIHYTITGVAVPDKISVMQRWWDAAFQFASDDPVNNPARYDRLVYDANNDAFFRFIDVDGTAYKAQIMAVVEVERLDVPDAHVFLARCTFRQSGHIR